MHTKGATELMIRLDGVSRTYRDGDRDISALKAVHLHIPPGCSVALEGKSGSGKSTLLHLMGGVEWPSAGRITVAGQALGAMTDAELTKFRLRHIGFVFQFFHLLPTLTVMENLALPAELAGLPSRERGVRARARLEEVGLADRGGTYPDRLSGGEQQRVAVARALMLDPPVLLADEPTGNLDSETGNAVLDLMWKLAATHNTTLVIATHSHALAARLERRIELQDGRIVSDSGLPRIGAGAVAGAGTPPPPASGPASGSEPAS